MTGASVMIGVGDIAVCGTNGDEGTARIVDSVLRADSVAKVKDAVFTLGDNAYPDGSASDFALCFTPSWGDSTKRIMKEIHPAIGNHEHVQSVGASPYFQYFGSKAGDPKKGYYSYDVGDWHVIVLNSELIANPAFTGAEQTAQEDWLRNDLKGSTKKCTMAIWHNPRFSSGWHHTDPRFQPLWQILYDADVDLILNGHDHDYERFRPQNPSGVADSVKGITEIVAGTGGGDLRGFETIVPNSVTRIEGRWGVLKLTLGKDQWRSVFIEVGGRLWDESGGTCH
ncbi:MAG: metallophosphoesterase family protein [Gemmatimonadales bacterium]